LISWDNYQINVYSRIAETFGQIISQIVSQILVQLQLASQSVFKAYHSRSKSMNTQWSEYADKRANDKGIYSFCCRIKRWDSHFLAW